MSPQITYEQLLAVFEAARTDARGNGDGGELDDVYVDWADLWAGDDADADWLVEPIIPAHRSVALFAPGGHGKSLLALWLAAALAAGRTVFGTVRAPVDVLYLDYEMTRADLRERLEAMGYGPDDDLSRLHYALLPPFAPLDGRLGGDEVVSRAAAVGAELVVVDTFGRAVAGDENEADTVQAWYRWTGRRLKADGRAFVRIDHAGKDVERGQRGSSAKNDDVDIVWRLTRIDNGLRLVALKQRMQWVPDSVELVVHDDDDDLTYTVSSGMVGVPEGTAAAVALLDELAVPADWGRPKVRQLLKDKGHGVANGALTAAIKYRKNQPTTIEKLSRGQLRTADFETLRTPPADNADRFPSSQVNGAGQSPADRSGQGAGDNGPGGGGPRSGPPGPSLAPPPSRGLFDYGEEP